jgi:hypothetical protein
MDITRDKFLLAFHTFISRRGLPHTIYTNNAQAFHAANRELTELWTTLSAAKTHQNLAQNGIIWKFIVEGAAWWGGLWERIVGSTKRSLRKVLGRSQVDEEEFCTVLTNTKAALNSRSITQDDNETFFTFSQRWEADNHPRRSRTNRDNNGDQSIPAKSEAYSGPLATTAKGVPPTIEELPRG